MFRRQKRQQSDASGLRVSRSERKRIETRFAAAMMLTMRVARESGTESGAVHVLVVDETSARAHAELMGHLAGSSDTTVARLSSGDSDSVRAKAYRASVAVGTIDDFVADAGREESLGITRNFALVEGDPGDMECEVLSRYRSVAAV